MTIVKTFIDNVILLIYIKFMNDTEKSNGFQVVVGPKTCALCKLIVKSGRMAQSGDDFVCETCCMSLAMNDLVIIALEKKNDI